MCPGINQSVPKGCPDLRSVLQNIFGKPISNWILGTMFSFHCYFLVAIPVRTTVDLYYSPLH